MYRFYIDGKDISSFLFMPGWTDYSKRLQVQTFDVTPFLAGKKGSAQLSALLGNGWAAAKLLAWQERPYAPFPSFIAEMTVLYRDGTKEIFGTAAWTAWFPPSETCSLNFPQAGAMPQPSVLGRSISLTGIKNCSPNAFPQCANGWNT